MDVILKYTSERIKGRSTAPDNHSLNVILLACLFFGLCFCTADKLDENEKTRIKSEITQTISDYCRDVKAYGLTAELKYLDSTNEFRWHPPGYASPIGFDSVASILRQNAPRLKSVANVYESLDVVPADINHATYSAVVRSTVTDNRGQVTRLTLSESGTVIRRVDGWKLLVGETRILPN